MWLAFAMFNFRITLCFDMCGCGINLQCGIVFTRLWEAKKNGLEEAKQFWLSMYVCPTVAPNTDNQFSRNFLNEGELLIDS